MAAITVAFAVVDLAALSRRQVSRAHGLAVAVYVGAWVVVAGLSLPVAPLGSLWWVFPAVVRVAVFAISLGGQLLADLVRAEQSYAHPERRQATPTVAKHKLTVEELAAAEAFDEQWQRADRERNHEQALREEREHHQHHHPANAQETGPSGDGLVSAAAFDRLVQDAVDRLPASLRSAMANVSIVVEQEPPPGQRLLGLYQGIPLTRRGRGYSGALPDKITLYRGPLERQCAHDPARLPEQVQRVVWHEIAHHFGISDQRLIEIDRY